MLPREVRLITLSVLTIVVGIGCGVLHNAGVPGLEMYVKKDPAELQHERDQREQFILNQDHKALFWLISHRLDNAMTLSEVEQVLGVPGEYTADDSYGKSEGLHQTTDMAYKWGPDNRGQSVILFFRDGRLSNFDPKDYRDL